MVTYSFYESDTRVMQYATALVANGHSVDVFCLRPVGSAKTEVLDGVNVYRIQGRDRNERSKWMYLSRIVRFLFVSAFEVVRKYLADPYTVLHIHSVPDFLVLSATIPKLLGARVILDIHDIFPEFYASKFGHDARSFVFKSLVVIERLSIACCDHVIIANDLWRKRLIARSVSAQKCTAILNYPDPDLFRFQARPCDTRKFLMVYPGTLNAHQGLDVAIRAFARVSSELPDAEFHIYGDGPAKPALSRLIRDLHLTNKVTLNEWLPTKQIAKAMAVADVAIVPKRASNAFGNEAASTKIMEFMALGVPVIASRTQIDLLYHDESRIQFFESENELDLAKAIKLLHDDPELRERLITNALRYVAANNWRERRKDYLAIVNELASATAGRSRARRESGVSRV